ESCALPGSVGTCNFTSVNTVCRAAAGLCDVAEGCDGASRTCPNDKVLPQNTECAAAGRPRGEVAVCDGTTAARTTPKKVAGGAVGRPAGGPCDTEDLCDGQSPLCPDALKPQGASCAGGDNLCLAASLTCSGTSAACAGAVPLPSGTICRAAAGACDVPE